MPNIKAAVKWARQTEKRSARNKDVTSRLKTLYKKGASGTTPASEVESALDKASSKGVIHKNKAARKKSRLAKALGNAAPSASAPKARKGGKTAIRKKR